jgi:malonyl-CoA O-methyltransferase
VAHRQVSVLEGYGRWAQTYDRDPNPILDLEKRRLPRQIPPLEGKRVLDLACGTGRWLEWLTAWGAGSAVGLDLTAAMLAVAKDKPAARGRVVQADCREIPFAEAVFDLVICSFALAHLSELKGLAREVARVATAGARVLVSDLHPQAHAQGWRTGFRDHRGAAEISTWQRSTEELITPWLSAGFMHVKSTECWLGEPARAIFARTGKAHLFEEFCQIPAIIILHFQRPD